MIVPYWPGKDIPGWLFRIQFIGESDGVPAAKHNGFGVIIKCRNAFHVFRIRGPLMIVTGAGMTVRVSGQCGGVFMHSSFKALICAVFQAKP